MNSLSSIHETEASPANSEVAGGGWRVTGEERMSSPTTRHSPPATLEDAYRTVRRCTEALCEPLASEDYVLQSMPDASPVKWHLAHTAWFFETFLLVPHLPGYRPFHPQFRFLFNSYYQGVGPCWPRLQ
jgi:hypothetical protein